MSLARLRERASRCQNGARHPKKGRRVLCERPYVKYAFIKDHRTQFPVFILCRTLKVSRSGFYVWLRCVESKRSIFWRQLLLEINQVHEESHQRYGAVKYKKGTLPFVDEMLGDGRFLVEFHSTNVQAIKLIV